VWGWTDWGAWKRNCLLAAAEGALHLWDKRGGRDSWRPDQCINWHLRSEGYIKTLVACTGSMGDTCHCDVSRGIGVDR
jgi:hypothetical protein